MITTSAWRNKGKRFRSNRGHLSNKEMRSMASSTSILLARTVKRNSLLLKETLVEQQRIGGLWLPEASEKSVLKIRQVKIHKQKQRKIRRCDSQG